MIVDLELCIYILVCAAQPLHLTYAWRKGQSMSLAKAAVQCSQASTICLRRPAASVWFNQDLGVCQVRIRLLPGPAVHTSTECMGVDVICYSSLAA